jgi:quinol monooxygenase YgiN
MPYVRLTIVKPVHGREAQVEDLMRRLSEAGAAQEGCLASYILHPHDDSGEVARLAIYSDVASADKAANSNTFLSLRAELHLAVEPDHVERAFFTD